MGSETGPDLHLNWGLKLYRLTVHAAITAAIDRYLMAILVNGLEHLFYGVSMIPFFQFIMRTNSQKQWKQSSMFSLGLLMLQMLNTLANLSVVFYDFWTEEATRTLERCLHFRNHLEPYESSIPESLRVCSASLCTS